MNPFEMVVLIVFITAIAGVLRAKYGDNPSNRNRKQGLYAPRDDTSDRIGQDTAQLEGEIRQLKDRIAVLERLATDDQRTLDLDREIAKLRDKTL